MASADSSHASHGAGVEPTHDEEAQLLDMHPSRKPNLLNTFMESVDIFKGMLVILMTWCHAQITFLNQETKFAHIINNAAASLCFLGFMLSYGFACDIAYISDHNKRPAEERVRRMFRSALLPVLGAWFCAFSWAYLSFDFPHDCSTVMKIFSFWLTPGNGPDFLLCFTTSLLIMYSLRKFVNAGLASAGRLQLLTVTLMLMVPLAQSCFAIYDCTGNKRYLAIFFPCTWKEPWSPTLPALPHLFYFNLGLLVSRGVRATTNLQQDPLKLIAGATFFTMIGAAFSYPLLTVWPHNYGNIYVATPWGKIIRGFADGPSLLWLLGNVYPVIAVLVGATMVQQMFARIRFKHWLVSFLHAELRNLGVNVLLNLVVADLILAATVRKREVFAFSTGGCAVTAFAILGICRGVQHVLMRARQALGISLHCTHR